MIQTTQRYAKIKKTGNTTSKCLPWIWISTDYPWRYSCVDMRFKPFCKYIYGYYAGALAN